MKHSWHPIAELIDLHDANLLLCAPELVDLDCNPHGVAPGYWQDGPNTPGGDEPGEWIAAGYCMVHDCWVNRSCNPTHFMVIEGPEPYSTEEPEPYSTEEVGS